MLALISFLVFLHICSFLFLSFMPWWCWKTYLFTCLSSQGKLAYVGCYENKWNTKMTKRKARWIWETMHDKDENFWEDWKCKNIAILSEGSFRKHRIKQSWLNLNLGEIKQSWSNLNLRERLLGLKGHGRIWILVRLKQSWLNLNLKKRLLWLNVMAESESWWDKTVVAESESRREAVRIKRSWPNLNLGETKWSWLNLNLRERLLRLNDRGWIWILMRLNGCGRIWISDRGC